LRENKALTLVLCCCDQIPEQSNLQKEGFILAYGFRGFRAVIAWAEHHGSRSIWQRRVAHIMVTRKEREI
jgi:hypothetical protein